MKTKLYLTLAITFVFSLSFASALTESITLDDYVLDIEYDETEVNSGETFRIEVTVTNEAGVTRTGVELEVDPDSPFDNVGDDTKDLGTMSDNEEKSVSFRIEVDENTEERDYDLEFIINDNEAGDDSEDIAIEVKNDDSDLIIGEKNSFPAEISPDTDDIKLTLTIENIGNGDADFVRATLELPNGIAPSGSFGSEANLGTITAGDNKEVDFYLDTDKTLREGNLEASLLLEYDEEDGDSTSKRLDFDIPVKGKAQFSVIRTTLKEEELTPGSTNTLYLTLQNTGSDDGDETTVRVFEHSDLPIEFTQKTSLIGDLRPSQQGTASIEFEVDSDADTKNYLIRAQTRSITNGVVTTEDFTIPITVDPAEERSPLTYLIGLIVLLLIGITVMIVRR